MYATIPVFRRISLSSIIDESIEKYTSAVRCVIMWQYFDDNLNGRKNKQIKDVFLLLNIHMPIFRIAAKTNAYEKIGLLMTMKMMTSKLVEYPINKHPCLVVDPIYTDLTIGISDVFTG